MNGLWFCILGLFWSGSFLAIKIAVTALPALFAALMRVLIAQIAFTVVFTLTRQTLKVPFASFWRLWIIGIFLQGLPFAFLFWGERSVAPALASIINSTVAVWTFVFGILLFRDYSQVTLTKISGLILGTVGTLVIFLPLLLHQPDNSKLLGVLSITGMAMSYAFGALLSQRFGASRFKVSLKACLWHQHWGSLLFLLVVTLVFEHRLDFASVFQNIQVPLALLYLGLCSTAIAWMCYVHLLFAWGALRTATVLYLTPILAILWDYLFLHIAPHFKELIGVVIIFGGVALVQFGKNRQGPAKSAVQ